MRTFWILTAITAGVLQAVQSLPMRVTSQTTPNFTAESCRTFRNDLERHTDLSRIDRRDCVKLGISSLALFWIPVLPSLPLGISAIVLGMRTNTEVRKKMLGYGITLHNWESVNFKCSMILKVSPLRGVTFRGEMKEAIDLGSAGIALTISMLVLLIVFVQCCTVSISCWGKDDCSAEYTEYVTENC